MESTKVKGIVNALAESVWGIISPFVGIENFVPAIEKSAGNGEGEGMERTCTLGNSASFDETLLKVDHQNMELQYNVHDPSPFPFSGYVSTMKVTPMESDKCEVSWSCTYQVDSGTVEETDNLLKGLFQSGIEGLGKLTS